MPPKGGRGVAPVPEVSGRDGGLSNTRSDGACPDRSGHSPERSSRDRYHRADERARAPDRGRAGLPVRGVRGRPRRPVHGARPSAPVFRRTTPGAAGARAPGGVLPLVGIRGLSHVPGLGPPRSCRRPPGSCRRPPARREPVHPARGAARAATSADPCSSAVRPAGRNRPSASTADPAGLGGPAPVGRQRPRQTEPSPERRLRELRWVRPRGAASRAGWRAAPRIASRDRTRTNLARPLRAIPVHPTTSTTPGRREPPPRPRTRPARVWPPWARRPYSLLAGRTRLPPAPL